MRTAALVLVASAVLGLIACDRSEAGPPAAKPAETRAADGSRSIAITVSEKGYQPARASARAGEKLTLVFTRTAAFECGQFVKVPGVPGQTELPVGKPVAIKTTMPATGELVFTCGMDMLRGVVTVVK